MKAVLLGFFVVLLVDYQVVYGDKLLKDMDLTNGNWEMVAISLHNAVPSTEQKELGSFVLRNMQILKVMQTKWDYVMMFNDNCDYHYALKFYRNKQLVKTLKVNTICKYITSGSFSYTFEMNDLVKYRDDFQPIPWSRVRFSNVGNLRMAVKKLATLPEAYLYDDPKPFDYDGFIIVSRAKLNWNVNKDSLLQKISKGIETETGAKQFYVVPYLQKMGQDGKMTAQYQVFCDEYTAQKYKGADLATSWRSHLADVDFLQLIVVGVDKESFFKIMQ